MQIRCYHCHRPFALSNDIVHTALETLNSEHQHYYNAHCPHCGKVTQVSLDALKRAAPTWKPGEANQSDEQKP